MFIKGFDKNLRCRGMQFEIGKTYDTGYTENLELCSCKVFHFCKSLEKVHEFYSASAEENNRFCEIEVLGKLVEDENKCGSNKIKILREITGEELANLRGLKNGNTGLFNTGNCNTGYRNTGNFNTGYRNTGNCNTGSCNTGYYNTGNFNTGYRNTGYCNTGYRNTGDYNTGMFNACNRSAGLFNTKERTLTMFNKDSEMTWNEFINSEYYDAIHSSPFSLTEWIYYTEEEKKNSPIRQAIGGYLKKYTFKEACKNWWDNMTDENKDIIQSIPNFDKKIFKEITGIEVQE